MEYYIAPITEELDEMPSSVKQWKYINVENATMYLTITQEEKGNKEFGQLRTNPSETSTL